ncbi:MAG TPA: hypothetical protein PKK61_07575 [Defluviitaleaceae bacterium]|nr:hypothetical protein [Defluviitaleaceae bacterium]
MKYKERIELLKTKLEGRDLENLEVAVDNIKFVGLELRLREIIKQTLTNKEYIFITKASINTVNNVCDELGIDRVFKTPHTDEDVLDIARDYYIEDKLVI